MGSMIKLMTDFSSEHEEWENLSVVLSSAETIWGVFCFVLFCFWLDKNIYNIFILEI